MSAAAVLMATLATIVLILTLIVWFTRDLPRMRREQEEMDSAPDQIDQT